ncbi:MAG: LamG-like jellyroll fold domain-containing protein [Puniceicoccales bacterium]
MNIRSILLGGTALIVTPILANAQTMLVEYLFNGTGTTVQNTGTLANADLNMLNSDGQAADLYGSAGSGVSGAASDFSFNNTASTGMGTVSGQSFVGGRAEASSSFSMDSQASFTISGWLNTTALEGSSGNILDLYNTSGETPVGVRLSYSLGSGGTVGTLGLKINGENYSSSTGGGTFHSGGEWVFFAVTYDGTATTNNVVFYIGDKETSVVKNATRSSAEGTVAFTDADMTIGNVEGWNGRPFDGMLDDIRMFGSTTDASGVLSISEIEAYRAADAIPEPSESAMILGGVLLLLALLRRRASK